KKTKHYKYGRAYRTLSLWRGCETRWYEYQKAFFCEPRISRYSASLTGECQSYTFYIVKD
ncbi:MAG TPA: hypothetical protein V6D31_10390, partial [Candidatus Sericytochromatia bacterium]